jgi:hypothetical protein
MSLKVKGVVHQITPTETGKSKAGKEWVKKSLVIDTSAQYNPYISLGAFGDDKCDLVEKCKVGDEVEISFNLSSREYQGKWYTQADLWKIEKVNSSIEQVAKKVDAAINPVSLEGEDDGLPF